MMSRNSTITQLPAEILVSIAAYVGYASLVVHDFC